MSETLTFSKLVPDGKAMAYWNDKAVFVAGPLPKEVAKVQITRSKPTWAEASLVSIVTPSKHRHEPSEEHFLSCSPWQGVDHKYQLELKTQILKDIYDQPSLRLDVGDFHKAIAVTGYRNKLEFSVMNVDGVFQLAFHARGRFDVMTPAPDGCILGTEAMNRAAKIVAARLVEVKLDSQVETITVRESISTGAVIVVVTIKKDTHKLSWSDLGRIESLQGLRVVSKIKYDVYKTVYLDGETHLEEIVGGVTMLYPWDSFFQVNLPMFEMVLADIRARIEPGVRILDLYGGAGSIGLALAKDGHHVSGVEINESSVKLANANAQTAGIESYRAVCASAELIAPISFEGIDTVIVDPPRAGLHAGVVQMLVDAKPKRIIYVSCNPITQARDLAKLAELYAMSPVTGYDLYPSTLHLEALVTLDLKTP
jgi:23S rRNA (uracil1939-C5)-methyltransferase